MNSSEVNLSLPILRFEQLLTSIAMATLTQTATETPKSIIATDSTDSNSRIPRGPVTAKLNFFAPPADNSIPFQYVEEPPEGLPKRNYSDAEIDVQISDIRGSESAFNLDTHAFQALSGVSSSPSVDFNSDASVQEHYYPEVESLLLSAVPGATRVQIFDHTIRRTSPSAARAPVTRVHIDQTPSSALARVSRHLPAADAEELLKSRVRIINVWRPINGAVESFPLAFADSSSVPDAALGDVELRYSDRTGVTASVQNTDGQRWLYWSGVDDNERLFLQCFDSKTGSRLPHSAFVDPRSSPDAKGRESIEVRALVFG